MIAYIKGKEIIYNNEIVKFSELYTKDFYSYANDNISEQYCFGTPADNIIYFYHVLSTLSLYYFFREHKIEEVVVEYAEKDDRHRIANASELMGIKCNLPKNHCKNFISYIQNYFIIFFTAIYFLLLNIFIKYNKYDDTSCKQLIIIRGKATKEKMPIEVGDYVLEEKNIGRGSFYEEFSRITRMEKIILSLIKSIKIYRDAYRNFQTRKLGNMGIPASRFLAFRLVHIGLWGELLDYYLKKHPGIKNVITGAYLDSYSQVEHAVSKMNGRKLIVIPHGMEDRIIYPCGLAGDVFYSTSVVAKNTLNELYHTNKFVYDENLLLKMYRKRSYNKEKNQFVYFTTGENNDIDYKIASHLSEVLEKRNRVLFLKFKPGYDVSPFNSMRNTKVIESLSESICDNVCLSRGSAVLVEALYNNSIAVQIVLPEDGIMKAQVVPSLDDKRIIHFYSFEELDSWIEIRFPLGGNK